MPRPVNQNYVRIPYTSWCDAVELLEYFASREQMTTSMVGRARILTTDSGFMNPPWAVTSDEELYREICDDDYNYGRSDV